MIQMQKHLSSTYQVIFEIVQQIPPGKVSTYGIIAQLVGSGCSPRQVGYALNQAKLWPAVPAHRVVNRNGLLTGRHQFETPTTMEDRLKAEGLKITHHQVDDFEVHLWNPLKDENDL